MWRAVGPFRVLGDRIGAIIRRHNRQRDDDLPDSPIPANGALDEAPLVGPFQLMIPARILAQKRP